MTMLRRYEASYVCPVCRKQTKHYANVSMPVMEDILATGDFIYYINGKIANALSNRKCSDCNKCYNLTSISLCLNREEVL